MDMNKNKIYIGTEDNSKAICVDKANPELESAYTNVIDFDVVVNLMDDAIREQTHAEFVGDTEEEFLLDYLERDPSFWGVLLGR